MHVVIWNHTNAAPKRDFPMSGCRANPMNTAISLFAATTLTACAATAPPPVPATSTVAQIPAASSTTFATTSTPATAAPRTAAISASPSPDMLKKARLAGYHIKKLPQGDTLFCKVEAHVGSRFIMDSCMDETQFEQLLLRAESMRDSLRDHIGTATDNH
jgi:hypothetical protein